MPLKIERLVGPGRLHVFAMDRQSTMGDQQGNVSERARLSQIRFVSRFFETLGTKPRYEWLLQTLRNNFLTRGLLTRALGFRRKFDSLPQARRAAAAFNASGHEHPANVERHLAALEKIRESDYPVLYYWSQIRPMPLRVLDLGGNVGNLFFAYHRYLCFPGDLKWRIVELPSVREAGERLAAEKNEGRIRYVDKIAFAGEVDLFLSSGSLHYFDESLPDLLLQLNNLPPHVIVNRVPVCRGKEICTVQDGWAYVVACKIQNLETLVGSMEKIGYELVESWEVNEMKELVPLYPESSAFRYSGFYFRKPSEKFSHGNGPDAVS
jgi:putative methyltransferase (TIGR04325 family)